MLTLLHPAALWTLAALALPLAVHLRRPPPRTVRLGSLRFLENVPRRPLRHRRWRELLLLCTRLGLLAALSLLLAGPRWTPPPPAGLRRWALLDPTATLAGDALGRWHQAQADGDELRRLAPGFPAASTHPSSGHAAAPDLWSLLREADAELPAGSTLRVFSPTRVAALRGSRPALVHCRVEWVQTPDASGGMPHVWVLSARGQRVVAGRSDARATTFAAGALGQPLVFPAHEDARWRTEPGGTAPGSTHVLSREDRPADTSAPWSVEVSPPAVSVLILHDAEHAADARYVETAVRAAAETAARPVNLQNRDLTPDAENAAPTDWVFWLSTGPLPDNLAARAPRIVRYAGGDAVATADHLVAPDEEAADGVSLWKHAIPATAAPVGTVWWSDGRGDPVLTSSRPAAGQRWEFRSRFDPVWNDLPRTSALPAWMRSLLFPAHTAAADPVHDRRLADPAQGLPSDVSAPAALPALAPVDQPARDLHWPLWALAALLFAVERTLSQRRRAAPAPTLQTPRSTPVAASR